jgi:hypothetical protein
LQITRNSVETRPGPSEWFTGAVYLDAVAAPSDGSRLSASSVHFSPGARTAWHTHPNGATATRFMTHIALLEVGGDGESAAWGDHVSDEEYGAAPALDG